MPGGLFWTVPLPADSVVPLHGNGRASLLASGLETKDFGNIVNDLQHGPSVPAIASFDVQWSGRKSRFKVRNEDQGFRGQFVETSATMEWSAVSEAGFEFVSDPAETSHSEFATLGQEKNGVFF